MISNDKNSDVDSPVKRSDVATPQDVRRVLEVSPEKEIELKAEQDKLLRLHRSRARLTPEEQKRARGIELERHHRQTGNKDALAEALAMEGRFAEAALTAKKKELRKYFRDKRDAVLRDDADCKCDTYYTAEDGTLLPNQHVVSYDYSERHKAVVPFIYCRECGQLNARPMLPHLAEQRQQRRLSEKGNEVEGKDFFKNASSHR